MSLRQLQGVVGGELKGRADVRFSSVSTDTRSVLQGELFVALRGPNFNGNRFVQQAEQAGACAAVVSEAVATSLPLLQVEDTRKALGLLGAHNRLRSRAKVLALTGSQGKTTVKEFTAGILAQVGEVLFTKGNLNNEYGVPITLLRIAPWHQFAVIELGANARNEIIYTARLTNPDIALINNVAATHIEGFGSLAGVAQGKAEIWQGLSQGGTAIINLDDANIVQYYADRPGIRKVTISAAGKTVADYSASDIASYNLEGSSFMLHTPKGNARIRIKVPGRHNVANALAAAALAMEAGAGLQQVSDGLQQSHGVKGRLNIKKGHAGAVILDDSYNASPSSFRAAIDLLAELPGLRIVAAGDMGELGADSAAAHTALGEYAAGKGIQKFFGTGKLTALAVQAFGREGVHAADCDELSRALLQHLAPGVSVLVKGSRSAGMERVVKQLTEEED